MWYTPDVMIFFFFFFCNEFITTSVKSSAQHHYKSKFIHTNCFQPTQKIFTKPASDHVDCTASTGFTGSDKEEIMTNVSETLNILLKHNAEFALEFIMICGATLFPRSETTTLEAYYVYTIAFFSFLHSTRTFHFFFLIFFFPPWVKIWENTFKIRYCWRDVKSEVVHDGYATPLILAW